MYEQIEQKYISLFSESVSHNSYRKRSNKFTQQRGQILLDIWPVSMSMSVFMAFDYLLRGESHVDPSAVYFSVYCNRQGTSMQSTVNMNVALHAFRIQNITLHL